MPKEMIDDRKSGLDQGVRDAMRDILAKGPGSLSAAELSFLSDWQEHLLPEERALFPHLKGGNEPMKEPAPAEGIPEKAEPIEEPSEDEKPKKKKGKA